MYGHIQAACALKPRRRKRDIARPYVLKGLMSGLIYMLGMYCFYGCIDVMVFFFGLCVCMHVFFPGLIFGVLPCIH
jgi:hypothetical protein